MIKKTTLIRNKTKFIILLSYLLIISPGCTQDEMDIQDTGRKIVINGFLSSDSLMKVKISKSLFISEEGGYADSSFYSIKDASVCIYQNNIKIDSLFFIREPNPGEPEFLSTRNTFTWFNFGNYRSKNITPIPGREYKIVVKAPGVPDATAYTTIPNVVSINNVDTFRFMTTDFPDMPDVWRKSMKFSVEFTDPADENNYYLFSMWKAPSWDNNHRNLIFDCDDPVVEEKIEFLSSHYYVKTSSSWPSLGVAFTDKIINGQKYQLDVTVLGIEIGAPFDPGWQEADSHRKTVYLKLYSITEDCYRYIQTLNLYNKNYGNPLANPVTVYSNIDGGYGIFAGGALAIDSIVFNF